MEEKTMTTMTKLKGTVQHLESLFKNRTGPAHVLELGCAQGEWARSLAPVVDSWLGIDESPKAIEQAQRLQSNEGLSNLNFKVDSLYNIQTEGHFQVIVLGGILAQLQDEDIKALLESARLQLAAGGMVYVQVPIIPGIYPPFSAKFMTPKYRKEHDYCQLFGQCGFLATWERDEIESETFLGWGYSPILQWMLELSPIPQTTNFVLYPAPT